MSQWMLLERGFFHEVGYIGPQLYGPGDIVTLQDPVIPGPFMVPVDSAAKAIAAAQGLKIEPAGPWGPTQVPYITRYM